MCVVFVLCVDFEEFWFNVKGMCCGDVRFVVDLLCYVVLYLDLIVLIGWYVYIEVFFCVLLE